MAWQWIVVSLLSMFCLLRTVSCFEANPCPCPDESQCRLITGPPRQEVLGYSVSTNTWRHYDWTKITTIVVFRDWDIDLMCYAHSKNVRVVLLGIFPVANLTSAVDRNAWIKSMVQKGVEGFADGINIDIEEPIAADSPERHLLIKLVNDTRNAFLAVNEHAQVTFDVAWSPECVDGRCYDAVSLAEVTDFLVVMSYDEQGQIFHPEACVAGANSPFGQTIVGLQLYIFQNIPTSKLVLGQPWYGYDYGCEVVEFDSMTCFIKKIPYQGAPCSDAAGGQKQLKWIMKLLQNSTTGRLWDRTAKSPYFNFDAGDGKVHQVWYDDVESLSLKYALVQKLRLRGLAFWSPDFLDYAGSRAAQKEASNMWNAVDVHL